MSYLTEDLQGLVCLTVDHNNVVPEEERKKERKKDRQTDRQTERKK
jgi:hypothetical protein